MAATQKSPQLLGLEDTYDQVQLMAVGGMAEVYRARQKNLDRPVAIKKIRPELRINKDIQERFRREAKNSANLLHQNLAHVYDYKKLNDDAYIIMEWIDGFDLAEIIERVGPLPIDVAIIVAIKVLNGLTYVHSHGLVHRDLKPDNVRISTRGEIKIMDFGIALDPIDGNMTQPGTMIGSPHYLSPEQISGGKIDHRADIFSFGITLYEMLTGKKPFYETQNDTVYGRIQKCDYITPTNIRPDIPNFLVKVIDQCLVAKASRRPKTAEILVPGLLQYLSSNYSNEMETRVKKFLIQKQLLQGNANLIEVVEKTDPGPGRFNRDKIARFFHKHGVLVLLLLMGCVLAFWALSRRSHVEIEATTTEEVDATPPQDTGNGRIIKPRTRTNQ